MGFKNFYIAIILRLIIIVLLSMAIAFLFLEKQAYILFLLPLGFLILAIINIIRYFNNINKWISFFLLGIENEDTSLKVPTKSSNKAINDVYIGIDRLNQIFKQTKIDISTQEQYYRSIIDQSATGLFSINENGRVININPAAVKLTNLHEYHHVNALLAIDNALPEFIVHSCENQHQQSAIFENKYGQKLLFKLSEIKTSKELIKLVAVSDITKELDNREVDAWIKLARTLSHEIMNNIAPITTLSQVLSEYFTKGNKIIDLKEINQKTIANTVKGLEVIGERSHSLMNFVDNYRKFTKLPVPILKETNLSSLINNNLIVASTFPKFNTIKLEKLMPGKVFVNTDEKLLSQVIINLLKNACEALILDNIENPSLKIKLLQTNSTTRVEISNNGNKIAPEIREQIFIPFFTTKEKGTGVGLSLSKQIMLKMHGDVILSSRNEDLTTFVIILETV